MFGIGITVGVLFVLIVASILVYNKLIKNKNLMLEAWSGIDVFLKKRHDLVPVIVETVKAYATHEKTTLEDITRYRSDAMRAKDTENQIISENYLGKELNNLFVVAEKYPDLKANTNFLQLQQQITDLEHELEFSRRYYNGTVRVNNTYLEKFPSNIMAWIFNFRKGVFFATEVSERDVPQMSL
jgi:LemA protein